MGNHARPFRFEVRPRPAASGRFEVVRGRPIRGRPIRGRPIRGPATDPADSVLVCARSWLTPAIRSTCSHMSAAVLEPGTWNGDDGNDGNDGNDDDGNGNGGTLP